MKLETAQNNFNKIAAAFNALTEALTEYDQQIVADFWKVELQAAKAAETEAAQAITAIENAYMWGMIEEAQMWETETAENIQDNVKRIGKIAAWVKRQKFSQIAPAAEWITD